MVVAIAFAIYMLRRSERFKVFKLESESEHH
jgi:hypothetical protein